MTDAYKGESLGKKIARAWFWCCAEQATGKRFYTHKHLVLASREGGDVAVLKAMGVHPRNIVAMEMNASAAREFALANPDVQVRIGDAGRLVNHKDIRGKVVVAHLDFCSWATPSVLEVACRVGRFGVMDGGILCVGFMKGRETGEVAEAIAWWRQNMSDFNEQNAARRQSRVITSWAARVRTTDVRAQFVQWAIAGAFRQPGPIVATRPLASIGYDSGRTPMLYCPFRLSRHQSERASYVALANSFKENATRLLELAYDMSAAEKVLRDAGERKELTELATTSPELFLRWHPFAPTAPGVSEQLNKTEFGDPQPAMAVMMAATLEHHLPGRKAHALLNVRAARLAAWRAHASRGGYGSALAYWSSYRPVVEPYEPSFAATEWARESEERFNVARESDATSDPYGSAA